MKSSLLAGLDTDQAKEVREEFKASLRLRNQLVKVLRDKIETNREISCAKDAYVNGQWAYKQADAMGYERAMREFISILSEK